MSLQQILTHFNLQPFEAEFKVLNTGQVAIDLPISPHLSDLQPSDESADFHYFSLTMATHIEPDAGGPDVGIFRFTGRLSIMEACFCCNRANGFASRQI